jgi:hypothetical protein
MLETLPDAGEHVAEASRELHARPNADACERLALQLDGMRRHVLRVREALLQEAAAGGTRSA